jgi:hypothetical protein
VGVAEALRARGGVERTELNVGPLVRLVVCTTLHLLLLPVLSRPETCYFLNSYHFTHSSVSVCRYRCVYTALLATATVYFRRDLYYRHVIKMLSLRVRGHRK